jgi:hypothetical protein
VYTWGKNRERSFEYANRDPECSSIENRIGRQFGTRAKVGGQFSVLKRIFINLLVLIIACLASLFALEFGLRWFAPHLDPSGTVRFQVTEDRVPLGFANATVRQFKNTGDYDVEVAFNRYGLRDRKDLANADESDIFVVGDSYSMGWGVGESERFSDVLDELIAERVFNISIPTDLIGYSSLVRYAESHGAPIRRLVVGLCMENDLLDYDALEEMPTRGRPQVGLGRVKAWLTENSALYMALTTVVHRQQKLRAWAIRSGLLVDNIAGMRRNRFSEDILRMSADRLVRLIDNHDATVVVIPSRGLWVGGNEQTENRIHEAFVSRLRAVEIDVVDLRSVFEASGNPMQFHFDNDGHWNPRGHRMAATALTAHLANRDAQER